jgi:hypothetical protein
MDKNLLPRIGSIASLPLAALLLLFFFLPWLNVTCQGNEVASASGLQLAMGDISPAGMMKEQEAPEKDPGEKVDARPWFWLGLLVPLGLLGVGLMGAKGSMQPTAAGRSLIVLGAVGLVIVILAAATVDYAEMMESSDKTPTQPAGRGPQGPMGTMMQQQMEAQMKEAVKTEGTGILWGSLALYVLAMGCGALNYVMVSQVAASGPSAAPPGGGMGPPPPAPGPPGAASPQQQPQQPPQPPGPPPSQT